METPYLEIIIHKEDGTSNHVVIAVGEMWNIAYGFRDRMLSATSINEFIDDVSRVDLAHDQLYDKCKMALAILLNNEGK